MARYLLSAPAYIKDGYYPAGAIVDVPDDFPIGGHMQPARDAQGNEDPAARARRDEFEKQPRASSPGDPTFIGDMIAHTLADGATNGRVHVTSTSAPVAGPGVVTDASGALTGLTAAVPQPTTGTVTDAPGVTVPIKAGPDAAELRAAAEKQPRATKG